MARIIKRYLKRDATGRVLENNTERLTDSGAGGLNLTTHTTMHRCRGCGKHLDDIRELNGRCDYCGTHLCSHCEVRCEVCSRHLCTRHARGFVGEGYLAVCPVCLQKLNQRQAYHDRLLAQRLAYDQSMHRHRERVRLYALRQQAAIARANRRQQLAIVLANRRQQAALALANRRQQMANRQLQAVSARANRNQRVAMALANRKMAALRENNKVALALARMRS